MNAVNSSRMGLWMGVMLAVMSASSGASTFHRPPVAGLPPVISEPSDGADSPAEPGVREPQGDEFYEAYTRFVQSQARWHMDQAVAIQAAETQDALAGLMASALSSTLPEFRRAVKDAREAVKLSAIDAQAKVGAALVRVTERLDLLDAESAIPDMVAYARDSQVDIKQTLKAGNDAIKAIRPAR